MVSNLKLWALGGWGKQLVQQNTPHQGAGAAQSRDCPGHPPRCVSTSWLPFLFPGPNSGTCSLICQHTSAPGMSLCPPCQPQPPPPRLGFCLLWSPPEWEWTGTARLLSCSPGRHPGMGVAGRFPDFLRELLSDADGTHLEQLHVPCPHHPKGWCSGAQGRLSAFPNGILLGYHPGAAGATPSTTETKF